MKVPIWPLSWPLRHAACSRRVQLTGCAYIYAPILSVTSDTTKPRASKWRRTIFGAGKDDAERKRGMRYKLHAGLLRRDERQQQLAHIFLRRAGVSEAERHDGRDADLCSCAVHVLAEQRECGVELAAHAAAAEAKAEA